MEEILVRYHADIPPIRKTRAGDWIDLYAAEDVILSRGEWKPVSLGVSMRLPAGYEAHVAPRSSTYKTWGVIAANSVGVIDESYCGDGDVWFFPVIAMRDTMIRKGDRICQFRLMKKMPEVSITAVGRLDAPDRGGLGSTGTR